MRPVSAKAIIGNAFTSTGRILFLILTSDCVFLGSNVIIVLCQYKLYSSCWSVFTSSIFSQLNHDFRSNLILVD